MTDLHQMIFALVGGGIGSLAVHVWHRFSSHEKTVELSAERDSLRREVRDLHESLDIANHKAAYAERALSDRAEQERVKAVAQRRLSGKSHRAAAKSSRSTLRGANQSASTDHGFSTGLAAGLLAGSSEVTSRPQSLGGSSSFSDSSSSSSSSSSSDFSSSSFD